MSLKRLAQELADIASALRSKTACVISVGTWGDKKCLLKVRDRNYRPRLKVYHVMLDGVEVAYMRDEVTGWVEGLNEYGIGIVNTALMVDADEEEHANAQRGVKRLDGKRIKEGLKQKTVEEAAEAVKATERGLPGHTFIADKDRTIALEEDRAHDYLQKNLSNKIHTRTNHGIAYEDAGYQEGEDYDSSVARRDTAMKALRGLEGPDDIVPALMKARKQDRDDPNNVVRRGENDQMRTTSHLVIDLTDLALNLYLMPNNVQFAGFYQKLPDDHDAKITVRIYKIKDYDEEGEPDDLEILEFEP